jgi:probable rRNA maturation factor
MMIVLDDRYGYEIDIKKLETIKNHLTLKEVELVFVSDSEIAKINSEFRSKDVATDVLSFPLEEMPHLPLGSIVISIDRAKEVSSRLSHDCDDEVALLFIHGLLHLLGYDHESDEGQMREKEASLIKEFDLPNSLILRND